MTSDLAARAAATRAMPSLAAYEALVSDLLAHIDALTAKVEALPRGPFTQPDYVDRAAVLAILRGEA